MDSCGCDTSRQLASSTEKYVLCQMPANWATLPVHSSVQSTPQHDSIAVYAKKKGDNLVYEGFICPPAPEAISLLSLLHPTKPVYKKYEKLLEKLRADMGEEAPKKIISEDETNGPADSAAGSEPGQGAVGAEQSTTPRREDTADDSKQCTQAEAAAASECTNKLESLRMTESVDYPLPLEILDRRERLLPWSLEGGTEDFIICFDTWEDTVDLEFLKHLFDDPDPDPEQIHTPKDG